MRDGGRVALASVCAGVFLAAIDFYVVTVAVPNMLHEFRHSGIAQVSWVFNGYTITFTAALLPAAGLADRIGRRRVFLAGLGLFTISALASATAPTLIVLILARLVQGLAGGTITPLALPLIVSHFPEGRRGSAIGLWTATQSAAVAAGPSVGGALVSAVGWRGVFALQLPIGLVALVGVARVPISSPTAGAVDATEASDVAEVDGAEAAESVRMPDPAGATDAAGASDPAGVAESVRTPDLAGVLLLGPSIGLMALAIVQSNAWGPLSWRTAVSLGAGLLLGVAFVWRSLRHPVPVIDLSLLKLRSLRRATVVMLLTGLVMFAFPAAAVLFLIGVWRYPAALAGLAVTPAPVAEAVAALLAGRLCRRYGPRAVSLAGAAMLTASMSAFALATGSHSRYWAVAFPAVTGSGAAIGLLIIALSTAALNDVPPTDLASATSITVVARAAGAIVSLAALALILASAAGGTASLHAYHLAWSLMALISAVAIAASIVVRGKD
ncbi:MAG TPA: MFS transporter [Streptosporangiaceae bacterium]|nr:MFS transporter [Streptosporangiaceae bacterium]